MTALSGDCPDGAQAGSLVHNLSPLLCARVTSAESVYMEPEQSWSRPRVAVLRFLRHPWFSDFMSICLLGNLCTIILDTNDASQCVKHADGKGQGSCECAGGIVDDINMAFVVLYFLEMSLKVFVERWAYFREPWHIVEVVIVLMGILEDIFEFEGHMSQFPNWELFRIVRLTRLVRMSRFVKLNPVLNAIVMGLAGALRAMFWGIVVIFVLLLLWSILAVELIFPIVVDLHFDADYCASSFDTVQGSMLISFQMFFLFGDAWTDCVVPIINESLWTYPFFVVCLLFVQLGVQNLVLSVIVQQAAEARLADTSAQLKEITQQEQRADEIFASLSHKTDSNADARLSYDELMHGFGTNAEVQSFFTAIGLREGELKDFFRCMDEKGLGSVDKPTFSQAILRTCSPLRAQLLLLKLDLLSFQERLEQGFAKLARNEQRGLLALSQPPSPKSSRQGPSPAAKFVELPWRSNLVDASGAGGKQGIRELGRGEYPKGPPRLAGVVPRDQRKDIGTGPFAFVPFSTEHRDNRLDEELKCDPRVRLLEGATGELREDKLCVELKRLGS